MRKTRSRKMEVAMKIWSLAFLIFIGSGYLFTEISFSAAQTQQNSYIQTIPSKRENKEILPPQAHQSTPERTSGLIPGAGQMIPPSMPTQFNPFVIGGLIVLIVSTIVLIYLLRKRRQQRLPQPTYPAQGSGRGYSPESPAPRPTDHAILIAIIGQIGAIIVALIGLSKR